LTDRTGSGGGVNTSGRSDIIYVVNDHRFCTLSRWVSLVA